MLVMEDLTRTYELRLTAEPERFSTVRRIVQAHLRYWGFDPVLDPALLGLTELLANVHQHVTTGPECLVRLAAANGSLTVAVHDSDPTLPVLREADAWELTGRGLAMVAALSKEWGTWPEPDCHLGGKAVWFSLTTANVPLVEPSGAPRAEQALPVQSSTPWVIDHRKPVETPEFAFGASTSSERTADSVAPVAAQDPAVPLPDPAELAELTGLSGLVGVDALTGLPDMPDMPGLGAEAGGKPVQPVPQGLPAEPAVAAGFGAAHRPAAASALRAEPIRLSHLPFDYPVPPVEGDEEEDGGPQSPHAVRPLLR